MKTSIIVASTLVLYGFVLTVASQECNFSKFKPFRVEHYPKSAIARKVLPKFRSEVEPHGTVTIKALVNWQGQVERACVVEGEDNLREATLEAARKWLFKKESLRIITGKGDRKPKYLELFIQFSFNR